MVHTMPTAMDALLRNQLSWLMCYFSCFQWEMGRRFCSWLYLICRPSIDMDCVSQSPRWKHSFQCLSIALFSMGVGGMNLDLWFAFRDRETFSLAFAYDCLSDMHSQSSFHWCPMNISPSSSSSPGHPVYCCTHRCPPIIVILIHLVFPIRIIFIEDKISLYSVDRQNSGQGI